MKGKKLLSIVLCLVLLIAVISGCGEQKKSLGDNSERSLTHKISDEPIELTYFAKKLDDYPDNVFTEAFDKTNILLTPTLSENVTDMDQTLALAVAARDIPDIIYDWKQENFNKYGMQGALIPLNDLIDKYAPNYKKFLEEHPEVKYYSTASDGNIYFIPFVADGEPSTGWFIRQDWLDKLGLEAPKTVEEFYNTMVAFRDNDPNGNGKKDEIGFFGAQGDVASLFSLFDAYEGFRYTADGKVSYGPMEDNFLVAVKEVSKWYKEGLIDRELFTRTDGMDYFLGNNSGGISHGWFGSTAKRNDTLKNEIDGFSFVAFAPPAGPDGVQRELNRRNLTAGEGWAISATNKHPEETMKYFDFWWSEEGRRLVNFGFENIHYDLVDGKPIFKDSVINGDTLITTVMLGLRAQTNFGFQQDFGYEEQWINEIARDGMKMYVDGGYLPDPVTRPNLSYFENEKEHSRLKTQLETYIDEKVQSWILGMGDPEKEFEEFKKTLKQLGVEEYIEIEQAAYSEYLEVVK